MRANNATLRQYFQVDLEPGSLNVEIVDAMPNLRQQMDAGIPPPNIRIPHGELREMSSYLRDAQAWRTSISGKKFPGPVECWVLRRIGSKVRELEVVGTVRFVPTFKLQDGDELELRIHNG